MASLLLASCRNKTLSAPSASDGAVPRDAEALLVDSSPLSPPRVFLAPPLSAARVKGATVVAARERGGTGLVLSTYFDTAPADPVISRLGAVPEDSELITAAGDLGLLSREHGDGGSRRLLYRIAPDADAALLVGDPIAVGDAVCATLDGVHWLVREGSGFKGWLRPVGTAGSDVIAGPTAASQSEMTLVCGGHRAFLASTVEGQVRVIAWSRSEHDASAEFRPVSIPKPPLSKLPDDMLMGAMDDRLALVALEAKAIAVAIYRPDEAATRWQKVMLAADDEATLEAIEPDSGKIGLLLLRTVPRAKGCRGGEANDTVAEVAIFDVETGKLVRPAERIETWRCAAEPGPFFSGWAAGMFVIGWPRGADSACAHAGVRWGGLGFAVVDPAGGHARVGHTGPSGDTIAEVGCDALKCYAAVLTRGSDPCGPADSPEAGKLEIVSYPP